MIEPDVELHDLAIELVPIDELIEDPRNARRHPPLQVQRIARSLERFGQRKPVVAQGPTVIAGNGTLQGARELGWSRLAVVHVPEEWTDEEVRAFAIADNRTSDLAEWDYAELVDSLGAIGDAELIAASGFTDEDYDDLVAKLQEGDADPRSGGVRTTPSLEEYGQRYADKATRLLVCEFPNTRYIWLMGRMAELRRELATDNNADVVAQLVADRFSEPVGGLAADDPGEPT